MKRANPFERYLKPEDHLHMQVCRYIRYQYPSIVIHHSPNEGKRSPFERYLMTQLAVAPGFPDLLLICRRTKRLAALELKAGKNKPTDNQRFFIDLFNEVGIPATWENNFEAAKIFIDTHFK